MQKRYCPNNEKGNGLLWEVVSSVLYHNSLITVSLLNFQHPVADTDMSLNILGILILFEFLSECRHMDP